MLRYQPGTAAVRESTVIPPSPGLAPWPTFSSNANRQVFNSAVADGSLKVRVGGRYRLDEVGRAHTDLESRRTTGKLLIIP